MYRKSNKGWIKHIDFILIDMLSLEVSYFMAYMIRHGFLSNLMLRQSYYRMVFVLLLLEFTSSAILRTFSSVMRRGYYEELVATVKQTVIVTLLSVFYLFSVQEGGNYSRITLFLTGLLYAIFSYISRIIWKNVLRKRKPGSARSIILVSTDKQIDHMLDTFNKHNFSNIKIAGIILIDESRIGEMIGGVKVVANKDSAEEYVLSHWVDEVLFGLNIDNEVLRYLHKLFLEMGITTHQSLFEVQDDDSPIDRNIERIGGYTVTTRSMRMLTASELFLKRLMDIAGGIVGCLITVILFIFVAPAIYIASPGPIFFTQDRVGKNGKIFKMYKFRSMYLDAEERLAELKDQNQMGDSYMFKIENDPRIIGSKKGPGKGIGNFIRRTSIDEFPQFINVILGEMSIIGTRPPLLSEWEQYETHHRARLSTKPGITGLWQISGRNNITDFEDIVDLDTRYIENWSFGLDIKILFKTIFQVIKREGAV